jgi:hypothetical protein
VGWLSQLGFFPPSKEDGVESTSRLPSLVFVLKHPMSWLTP